MLRDMVPCKLEVCAGWTFRGNGEATGPTSPAPFRIAGARGDEVGLASRGTDPPSLPTSIPEEGQEVALHRRTDAPASK